MSHEASHGEHLDMSKQHAKWREDHQVFKASIYGLLETIERSGNQINRHEEEIKLHEAEIEKHEKMNKLSDNLPESEKLAMMAGHDRAECFHEKHKALHEEQEEFHKKLSAIVKKIDKLQS